MWVAMLLMGGLFVSDNAEFFKLADEQLKQVIHGRL